MRRVPSLPRWILVLAGIGGAAFVVALVVDLSVGDSAHAGWVIVGPTPFLVAGLVGAVRHPDGAGWKWLLASGAMFELSVCVGDSLLPAFGDRSYAWTLALARDWVDNATAVSALGLIGLFPTGRPQRAYERWVLRIAVVLAAVLPMLYAVTHPTMASPMFPTPGVPVLASPLYVAATAPAAAVTEWLRYLCVFGSLIGFVLLALRYRRTSSEERRGIRLLLLFGAGAALVVWGGVIAVAFAIDGRAADLALIVLWPIALTLSLGALVAGLDADWRLFVPDQPLRRSMGYRLLWTLIATSYVAAAATLGAFAAEFLPLGAVVVLVAAAGLLFQPAQRRVERMAARWVFGPRLDGYRVLTTFGAALDSAPRSADLLTGLAEAVRTGLGLRWVRVRLDLPDRPAALPTQGLAGDRTEDPELVVPLAEGGAPLGWIECGPRRDGHLLDEDRRLLRHLATQAAPAVRNLYLTAELTARVEVIRRQAADLTASRLRLVTAQDAERRRIQRNLHDGVQQDIVVLTTTLAMARERLRRGDPSADVLLASLQDELAALLHEVREFAHAIHPPVLADQGLLEAIEAQATRLPLETVIEADACLRGVRYPEHVEATAWYVLSEALTNVVKHADACRVRVALDQPDGRLTVEVRDDGHGFDPASPRGLGLTGLADRISIVRGVLRVDSTPGHGTVLHAEIPVEAPDD
ncbi:sensor histidine kinase [Cryptosporangium aurantiacum]|nr:GAF domain-containing sensor histidine kinase [Cryptosporangium aurantiacum]